tara:strand:- start:100 stop:687 length:588 start_codon:yes stop_codon:yes gene_type:complete
MTDIYGDAKVINKDIFYQIILENFMECKEVLKTIDVGSSGQSVFENPIFKNLNLENNILEYESQHIDKIRKNIIQGDICNCPEIKSESFDIVYCWNVLEHVNNPFSAADNLVRILKKGGIIVLNTPFSWNYHEIPIDYWRFTHSGLRYLLTKSGDTEIIDFGYHSKVTKDPKHMFTEKNQPKYPTNSLVIARKIK